MALERIPDKVIYDAPGLKPGMDLPVIVVLVGEDGDLWQLDAYDGADEDALETITEHSPGRVIEALAAYTRRGDE